MKTAPLSVWTGCEDLGADPQAGLSDGRAAPGPGGPGENGAGVVRSLVHTGMPLPDSRPGLFPTVPSPYSYNL